LTATIESRAEEVDKKFRLAFSLGSSNTGGKVHSASANRRTLFLPDGQIDDFIYDPRNDSGGAESYGIESQLGGVLSASYAVSRFWYVEASVGYREGTVGNVLVQAQFNGVQIPINQAFNFGIFNLDGGTISQVPVQFTAGFRFRPKSSFNPYLCAGIGYTFMSYSPSDELNQLSLNLDRSTGGFARLSGTQFGGEHLESAPLTTITNLSGIKVDVPDAPEWHFGGGFEWTVKSRWAIFVDARYYTYSSKFGMTVNGSNELGVSVPNDRVYVTEPGAHGPFGAVQITSGGLIDGGSFVPDDPDAPEGFCAAHNNLNCSFTGPKDGIPDLGMYYVQAGSVRYNGASLQIGVKFTF
jgi:opacity protein-like surface antigen